MKPIIEMHIAQQYDEMGRQNKRKEFRVYVIEYPNGMFAAKSGGMTCAARETFSEAKRDAGIYFNCYFI